MDSLTNRFNTIETLDRSAYRETLVDLIESKCGPLNSIPYESITTVDLITLAEGIIGKCITMPKTFNIYFQI